MKPMYRYSLAPLFAPWNALSDDAGAVVAMRLTLLPWLWAFDPARAERETRQMIDEKGDAWQETQLAMWQAPWRFWLDIATAGPFGLTQRGFDAATRRASARLAQPAHRRVRANRKRLG